ncbi:ABC transporter permease [Tomitella gaofuii]|uniref:ABC transporter permease n=1 Tax=Tomitella gaofuii TaxID=2760083 RepID=UPI0015F8B3CE|nr:ABC transporter permease [Tomitella gaofuii]
MRKLLTEAVVIFDRDLYALRRQPTLIAANLAGPLGLVLVFGYVFGGALDSAVPGASYREQIIPAAFVLVAGTGLVLAAGGAALDVANGVHQRLRTLPIRSVAVPLGSSLSQLLISVVAVVLMAGVGLLVGWRVHEGTGSTLAGFALLLIFGYALTWAGVFLGLAIRDQQVVQQLAPLIIAGVMVSNAFVPTATMPGWLGALAEWSPFSAAISALRLLFGNAPALDGPWPIAHPTAATLLWSVGLLLIFVPLAARLHGSRD